MAVEGIPETGLELTITVPDAAVAAAFYAAAFGAGEHARYLVPDHPKGVGPVKAVHMHLGGIALHISTANPRTAETMDRRDSKTPHMLRGFSTVFTLRVDDLDAAFARAVAAGARPVDPPQEAEAWGDRFALVEDPFGHPWGLAQRLRTVSVAEHNRVWAGLAQAKGKPARAPWLERVAAQNVSSGTFR